MSNDKPNATQIILSGVEGQRFFDTAYEFAECRNMLMAILYIEAKGDLWFEKRAKRRPDVKWMIDSSGHTFRKEGFCEKFPDWDWMDAFAERYHDWILKHKDLISLCVNLDIDCMEPGVGMDKMLEYDHRFFVPLEKAGVPTCFVWHEEYGFDFWLKMCREHEYVGLPGHLDEATYHRMMRPAMMNGCRVHGFAQTKAGIIGKVPFATVDSTTWKNAEKYGQTVVFENNKLRVYDHHQKEEVRARYKNQWVGAGIDWQAIEDDKAEETTKVCALAWRELQYSIATRSARLAYWQKTTQKLEDLGDPKLVTADQLQAFLVQQKCPIQVESDKMARGFLREALWICGRTAECFTMSDDALAWWVEQTKAEPENSTRVEVLAAVRDQLYQWFYSFSAEIATARTKPEDVEPVKKTKQRTGELEDVPSVNVELPDERQDDDPPTNPHVLGIGYEETDPRMEDKPTVQQDPVEPQKAQVLDTPDFGQYTDDRIAAVKATLAFELLFEQHKLKHEAGTLKRLRLRARRRRECTSKARKMADEITAMTEVLPDALADKVVELAQDMYDNWRKTLGDERAKHEAEKRNALANRPQNQITSEKARAMGRRGGAPPGNQNARIHGIHSKKFPTLVCDSCPHVQSCPQYKAGHVCAYTKEFAAGLEAVEGESPEMAAVRSLLEQQMIRARKALLFETFDGGILNKETTKVMQETARLAKMLHDMKNPVGMFGKPSLPAPSAGQPQNAGMLQQIFGGMGSKEPKDAEVISEKKDG